MPVRKSAQSAILRKAFLGDPSSIVVPTNPDPTTARGRRRSLETQEYLDNLATRQSQTAPAGKTRLYHKGPHSRPKGLANKEFSAKMNSKYEWEC